MISEKGRSFETHRLRAKLEKLSKSENNTETVVSKDGEKKGQPEKRSAGRDRGKRKTQV